MLTDTNITTLAVGRLVPGKRFDLAIRAWPSIASSLTIVGDGPQRASLQRSIHQLQLQNRVTLLGERHDVKQLMTDADLVIATSANEGFGYVILEALQAETVAISTPTGIARDLLPEEFLIMDTKPASLARQINRVIDQLHCVRHRFQPIWETAQGLTVQKMIRETLEVYRHTLSV